MACTSSMAGMVRLTWDYTGEGHKGFRLYYGKSSHDGVKEPVNPAPDPLPYAFMEEISDPAARYYEILLTEGKWYFRLTAIGEQNGSVFTEEEPMAAVGIDAPGNFKVEWILTKTKPREGTP